MVVFISERLRAALQKNLGGLLAKTSISPWMSRIDRPAGACRIQTFAPNWTFKRKMPQPPA